MNFEVGEIVEYKDWHGAVCVAAEVLYVGIRICRIKLLSDLVGICSGDQFDTHITRLRRRPALKQLAEAAE